MVAKSENENMLMAGVGRARHLFNLNKLIFTLVLEKSVLYVLSVHGKKRAKSERVENTAESFVVDNVFKLLTLTKDLI